MSVGELPKDPFIEDKYSLGEQVKWLGWSIRELLDCSKNYHKLPSARNEQLLEFAATHQIQEFDISARILADKKSPYPTEERKKEVINLLTHWQYRRITAGIRKIVGPDEFDPKNIEPYDDSEEEFEPYNFEEWLDVVCDNNKSFIEDEKAILIACAQKTLGGRFLDVIAAAKNPQYVQYKIKKTGKAVLKAFLEGFEKMATPPPV